MSEDRLSASGPETLRRTVESMASAPAAKTRVAHLQHEPPGTPGPFRAPHRPLIAKYGEVDPGVGRFAGRSQASG